MPDNDEKPSLMNEEEQEESEINSTRLDVTASLMKEWTDEDKQYFIDTLANPEDAASCAITTVHLSGLHLQSVLSDAQIEALLRSIGAMKSVTELFCFQGGPSSTVLTEDLLARALPPNLQVLMLWQFRSMPNSLAAAMRQHSSLSRITLNLPCPIKKQLPWGCLDVYAMAFCSMEHLTVLQIRCVPEVSREHAAYVTSAQQAENIITPEALTLLLNSTTIQHLYLENCGLIDDHMDVVMQELPKNKTLTTLDVKDNLFSDDCLYTTGRLLPVLPPQFKSLDVSGADISHKAGRAVAAGMAKNRTLLSLELEGTLQRFHDEFAVPDGHSRTEWMQSIAHQLRLNRAYATAGGVVAASAVATHQTPPHSRPEQGAAATEPNGSSSDDWSRCEHAVKTDPASFVAAVSAVSDSVSCIYHFLRAHPNHCDRLTVPAPYNMDHHHEEAPPSPPPPVVE